MMSHKAFENNAIRYIIQFFRSKVFIDLDHLDFGAFASLSMQYFLWFTYDAL